VDGNQPGVDPKPGDKVLAIDGVNVQSAGFAQIVSLTMGPLGSTCSLQLERWDWEADIHKVVECVVERCALDVPEPDFSKADALTDEEQLALMMPVQVRGGRRAKKG
jgi:C-terminal processing protease CtpA/Prc